MSLLVHALSCMMARKNRKNNDKSLPKQVTVLTADELPVSDIGVMPRNFESLPQFSALGSASFLGLYPAIVSYGI